VGDNEKECSYPEKIPVWPVGGQGIVHEGTRRYTVFWNNSSVGTGKARRVNDDAVTNVKTRQKGTNMVIHDYIVGDMEGKRGGGITDDVPK
jgi:hypothetical protein